MADKRFNTKIALRHDTLTNWETNNPTLLKGEIALVSITATDTTKPTWVTTVPCVLFKVGDGSADFKTLPYGNAPAIDVHSWAKAESKPSYAASEITGLDAFIAGEIKDTDTLYKLEATPGDNKVTVTLKSMLKGTTPEQWTVASTVEIPTYDDTALAGKVSALETKVGNTAVSTQIANAISDLNLTETYVSQTSFESETARIDDKIDEVSEDLSKTKTDYGNRFNDIDEQFEGLMPKTGGTFTGAVSVPAPTTDAHAATKKYVDDAKKAAQDYVDEATAGLTGAMHFKGTVESYPPTGSYVSGDVIIYGNKEYVYDGSAWHEMGDEGSFVLKTQKINGHSLDGDVTLTADDVGAATESYVDSAIDAITPEDIGAATQSDINSAVAGLASESYVNGKVAGLASESYVGTAITAATKDLATKAELAALTAEDVGAATQQDINDAIADLASKDDVSKAVTGLASETFVTEKVTALDTSLATIAKTGKVDDLIQESGYLIFNCGDSSNV